MTGLKRSLFPTLKLLTLVTAAGAVWWLGKERYTDAPPLWCDGSKVFLFGSEFNGETVGNAWDLSEGFAHRRLVASPEYGSWMPEDDGP